MKRTSRQSQASLTTKRLLQLMVAVGLVVIGTSCSLQRQEETVKIKVSVPGASSHRRENRREILRSNPPQVGAYTPLLLSFTDGLIKSPTMRSRTQHDREAKWRGPPPQLHLNQSSSLRSDASTYAFYPESLDDFDCFALNILGSGIPADSRLPKQFQGTCGYPGELPLGTYIGMVPIDGGEIEINIPSGAKRTIQVQAFRSKDGACPTLDDLLAAYPISEDVKITTHGPTGGFLPKPGATGSPTSGGPSSSAPSDGFPLSEPLEIGRTTIDISADMSVYIPIKYDPADPKFVMCHVAPTISVSSTSTSSLPPQSGTSTGTASPTTPATGGGTPAALRFVGDDQLEYDAYSPGACNSIYLEVIDASGAPAVLSQDLTVDVSVEGSDPGSLTLYQGTDCTIPTNSVTFFANATTARPYVSVRANRLGSANLVARSGVLADGLFAISNILHGYWVSRATDDVEVMSKTLGTATLEGLLPHLGARSVHQGSCEPARIQLYDLNGRLMTPGVNLALDLLTDTTAGTVKFFESEVDCAYDVNSINRVYVAADQVRTQDFFIKVVAPTLTSFTLSLRDAGKGLLFEPSSLILVQRGTLYSFVTPVGSTGDYSSYSHGTSLSSLQVVTLVAGSCAHVEAMPVASNGRSINYASNVNVTLLHSGVGLSLGPFYQSGSGCMTASSWDVLDQSFVYDPESTGNDFYVKAPSSIHSSLQVSLLDSSANLFSSSFMVTTIPPYLAPSMSWAGLTLVRGECQWVPSFNASATPPSSGSGSYIFVVPFPSSVSVTLQAPPGVQFFDSSLSCLSLTSPLMNSVHTANTGETNTSILPGQGLYMRTDSLGEGSVAQMTFTGAGDVTFAQSTLAITVLRRLDYVEVNIASTSSVSLSECKPFTLRLADGESASDKAPPTAGYGLNLNSLASSTSLYTNSSCTSGGQSIFVSLNSPVTTLYFKADSGASGGPHFVYGTFSSPYPGLSPNLKFLSGVDAFTVVNP